MAIQKGAAKVRTTEASGMYGEGEGKINIRSRTRIRSSTLSNWGNIRGYPGSRRIRIGNPGVDKGR